MEEYNSALLNALYANDTLISPATDVLHFKKNLLDGTTLSNMNGDVIFETMPSAVGGETIMFNSGETAHMTENIYGGTTIDFTGTTDDIVGIPSIFGGESFSQGGEYLGSIEPNFMGNGVDFTSSNGETLITTSPDIWGGTQVTFTSSPFDSESTWDAFSSFNDIDTISSHLSIADVSSVTDAIDGLDFLGLF